MPFCANIVLLMLVVSRACHKGLVMLQQSVATTEECCHDQSEPCFLWMATMHCHRVKITSQRIIYSDHLCCIVISCQLQ